MRTIRFKGKDLKTGEWVYGYYTMTHIALDADHGQAVQSFDHVHNIFNDEPGNRHAGGYWHEVDPDTIGQCSGLKDKDGHDIYEGDIVLWRKEKYLVKFWDGMFYASVSEFNPGIHGGFPLHAVAATLTTLHEGQECVVVGNIHDNPAFEIIQQEP